MLEGQLLALSDENAHLRAQVLSLQYHTGLDKSKTTSAASGASRTSAAVNPQGLLQAGLWSQQERGAPPSLTFTQGLTPQDLFSRQAEAELVSSSDDRPLTSASSSSIRALLPPLEPLHRASLLSYPPPNWLLPRVSHPVSNNFLLPAWRPSYQAPPAVHPGLPLYIQERQGQGLGVLDPESQRGSRSRFCSSPALLSQLGMHLGPGGR